MLSERIKLLRLSRGITQVELANSLSVSKQAVSNWENDNIQPSIDMLVKIAVYFSVSTDYLLGLDDRKYLEITHLGEKEIAHIQMIVNDISKEREHLPDIPDHI